MRLSAREWPRSGDVSSTASDIGEEVGGGGGGCGFGFCILRR